MFEIAVEKIMGAYGECTVAVQYSCSTPLLNIIHFSFDSFKGIELT